MSDLSATTISPLKKRQKTDEEETTGPRPYHTWSDEEESILLEWLTQPENFQNWKCAGTKAGQAGLKTNGKTKTAVCGEIAAYLVKAGTKNGVAPKIRTEKNVKDKLMQWDKAYKAADAWLKKTGNGLMDPEKNRDDNLRSPGIKGEVEKLCKYFFKLDAVMFDRAAYVPPYLYESGTAVENVSGILFPEGQSARPAADQEEPELEPELEPAADNGGLSGIDWDAVTPEMPTVADITVIDNTTKALEVDATKVPAVPKKQPEFPAKKLTESAGPKREEDADDKKQRKLRPRAPPTFTETLLRLEEQKAERAEKDRKLAELRLESQERLEQRRLDLQEKQMELEEKKLNAEIRKLELQVELRKIDINRD